MNRADLTLLVSLAVAAVGWCLPWPDPARAGYVLQWLAWCGLWTVLWIGAGLVRRMIAAAAIGVGLMASACASWWPVLSRVDGVCDEATGRPATAALAAIGLAVLSLYLTGGRDRANPND